MVTALRWRQKFVGRAESTLPFSTSAYLHLTTDFFLSKWKTFIRKPVSWLLRKSKRRAGPASIWFLSKEPLWAGLSECQALCSHCPRLSC